MAAAGSALGSRRTSSPKASATAMACGSMPSTSRYRSPNCDDRRGLNSSTAMRPLRGSWKNSMLNKPRVKPTACRKRRATDSAAAGTAGGSVLG